MKYNLSEINEVIRNRRSIRPKDFSSRKVHKEQIELLLENARWAPTHGNTQPWTFKVFMEGGLKVLADFHSETYKRITPLERFSEVKYNKLKNMPLKCSAVISLGMKRDDSNKIKEIEEIEAVACAVQNMHLTATGYGLACYWGTGGLTYTDEMKKFIGLREIDKCLGFFYIGYPGIDWPSSQRKPIEYYTEWVVN